MQSNNPDTFDGFIRKSYSRPSANTFKGRKAPWKRTEKGLEFLSIIVHVWEGMIGQHEAVTREFPKPGLLLRKVLAIAPTLPDWFKEQTGRDGSTLDNVVWNRGHKMCAYQNGPDGTKGQGQATPISKEHPLSASQTGRFKAVYLRTLAAIKDGKTF